MNTNYISTNVAKGQGIFGADQKRYIGGYVTEDDAYLVISANSTYGNELYIKDLKTPNSPIVTIVDNFNSDNSVIATEEKIIYRNGSTGT
jgi:prolyl oligopeptidase